MIGSLIGPGIGNAGNRDYKSLPAVFTDIEAQFLIEKDFVEVVEKPNLVARPCQEIKEQFHVGYKKQMVEMKSFEHEKTMAVFKEKAQQIYEGQIKSSARKRKKNEEFKMKTIEEIVVDHEKKLENSPLRNRLVHIPTVHTFDHGQIVSKNIKAKDKFKFRVYKDLWERGYTITCGETFSGDFLCYPGDPLHYHASHIVTIIDKNRTMNECEMVVHGRTSVSVKKGCLLVQEGVNKDIRYRKLKWVNPEPTERENIENS